MTNPNFEVFRFPTSGHCAPCNFSKEKNHNTCSRPLLLNALSGCFPFSFRDTQKPTHKLSNEIFPSFQIGQLSRSSCSKLVKCFGARPVCSASWKNINKFHHFFTPSPIVQVYVYRIVFERVYRHINQSRWKTIKVNL